jgi:hypothetical protein
MVASCVFARDDRYGLTGSARSLEKQRVERACFGNGPVVKQRLRLDRCPLHGNIGSRANYGRLEILLKCRKQRKRERRGTR